MKFLETTAMTTIGNYLQAFQGRRKAAGEPEGRATMEDVGSKS